MSLKELKEGFVQRCITAPYLDEYNVGGKLVRAEVEDYKQNQRYLPPIDFASQKRRQATLEYMQQRRSHLLTRGPFDRGVIAARDEIIDEESG